MSCATVRTARTAATQLTPRAIDMLVSPPLDKHYIISLVQIAANMYVLAYDVMYWYDIVQRHDMYVSL